MAATAKNIKDFFALTGNTPPITSAQQAKIVDWLEATTGNTVNADAVVDYLYQDMTSKVKRWMKDQEAVTF